MPVPVANHPRRGGGPGGACGHAGVQMRSLEIIFHRMQAAAMSGASVFQNMNGNFAFSGFELGSCDGWEDLSPCFNGTCSVRAAWNSFECHACEAEAASPSAGASWSVSLQNKVTCNKTNGPPTSCISASR